jgi:ketosteroid isomerase-like protein
MKKFGIILFVGLAFLSANCANTPQTNTNQNNENKIAAIPASELDVKEQEAEIKATLTDMWDAIEKGDIDRYASYIHPDFTQFGETARVLREGKEAEVKAIKDWIEEPTKVHTEMRDPKVAVRGDTAWITYYWEDEGTTKGEPFATKGKSTRIYVREKGKWLCIHGHYTLLEDEKK